MIVDGQGYFVFHDMLLTMLSLPLHRLKCATYALHRLRKWTLSVIRRDQCMLQLDLWFIYTARLDQVFRIGYFLHVVYRLDTKNSNDLWKKKTRKEFIQRKFRSEISLLLDQPEPGGCGTTNDGPMSRRFFKDPSHSATNRYDALHFPLNTHTPKYAGTVPLLSQQLGDRQVGSSRT